MAEQLTPQQTIAVTNRGGKLLVCAAAGSGKTKVLVDRLIGYLQDPVNPANLDDFLVITYTKAAAAELRGKIATKLAEHLSQEPDNRHLQKQMQRLFLAKISTVHAFCGDVLKEYAYLLDIPADFHVADENECLQLRASCMEKVLGDAYESIHEDDDFRAFVDSQGLGRDDRAIPEILFQVYDSARCHLNPESWLDDCLNYANVQGVSDAAQTLWGKYLMDDLFAYLDLQIDAMESCYRAASAADGMEKPAANLYDTICQLKRLRQGNTWDSILLAKEIDFGRLTFSKKCVDTDLVERIKAVRNACKKGIEKKLKSFSDASDAVIGDLQTAYPPLRGIVSLVRRFDDAFTSAKRNRRILDFSDLEQRMLDLLLGKNRDTITVACREISSRFREILVDEYQDSNAVQDAIFSALSQERQNCFMVGDVKQSIYQFRLADPSIFLEKHAEFVPAECAQNGQGRKVQLTSNFRSCGAVLSAVNDVFYQCMSPSVGGVVYDDTEALVEGIAHSPLGEPEVEFWAVDVQESTYEEEAAFVAQRVCELLDGSHYVRQKDELRIIKPDDIAILLRSPGSAAGYFVRALSNVGIRCTSGGSEDVLQTEEVISLYTLLQTIRNPRQDIPLLATLTSPIFGFTADDLAEFRGENRSCSVYEALTQSQSVKAKSFLHILQRLRTTARLKTLGELIEEIFSLTRMDSIFAAMPNGLTRKGNLLQFYQYAADFTLDGHGDLEQFLDHLSTLEDRGLISQAEQAASGAVTIMSIHKSKGLEFPVVIVSNLSREFNRESVRAQVLCNQDLGLGLSIVDTVNRVRYPSIAKRAIAVKTIADSLSEEMRVLYVALTRAKDRLIMTYAAKKIDADISHMANRLDIGNAILPAMDAVCPGDWVMMAALRRTEAGELFSIGTRPMETQVGNYPWLIRVVKSQMQEMLVQDRQTQEEHLSEDDIQQMRSGLAFQYVHKAATESPSKQTATQQKGRNKDVEVSQDTQSNLTVRRSWRKPNFLSKKPRGVEYGTAMHTALQYLHFNKCTSVKNVTQELERLVSQNLLTQEQSQMIDCEKIVRFLGTPLGSRLCNCENVLREFKFSILDEGENYAPGLEREHVLLQGVVDCALLEDDGITIIDFKSDAVTSQSIQAKVEQYRPQVKAYAQALSRIFEMPIKDAFLYFFGIEAFVKL